MNTRKGAPSKYETICSPVTLKNIVNDHCQPVWLFKSVWVENKNVHKVWEHILDSIDFISSYIIVFCFHLTRGQTHKTNGRGRNTLP